MKAYTNNDTFCVFDFKNKFYAGSTKQGEVMDIRRKSIYAGPNDDSLMCCNANANEIVLRRRAICEFQEIYEFDTAKEKYRWISNRL